MKNMKFEELKKKYEKAIICVSHSTIFSNPDFKEFNKNSIIYTVSKLGWCWMELAVVSPEYRIAIFYGNQNFEESHDLGDKIPYEEFISDFNQIDSLHNCLDRQLDQFREYVGEDVFSDYEKRYIGKDLLSLQNECRCYPFVYEGGDINYNKSKESPDEFIEKLFSEKEGNISISDVKEYAERIAIKTYADTIFKGGTKSLNIRNFNNNLKENLK